MASNIVLDSVVIDHVASIPLPVLPSAHIRDRSRAEQGSENCSQDMDSVSGLRQRASQGQIVNASGQGADNTPNSNEALTPDSAEESPQVQGMSLQL